MTLINEKEACIQILQHFPGTIKDKVEELLRQKEQLKHKLLTQDVFSCNNLEGFFLFFI